MAAMPSFFTDVLHQPLWPDQLFRTGRPTRSNPISQGPTHLVGLHQDQKSRIFTSRPPSSSVVPLCLPSGRFPLFGGAQLSFSRRRVPLSHGRWVRRLGRAARPTHFPGVLPFEGKRPAPLLGALPDESHFA